MEPEFGPESPKSGSIGVLGPLKMALVGPKRPKKAHFRVQKTIGPDPKA